MISLKGGTHYLVLHLGLDGNRPQLMCHRRFDESLRSLRRGSRVSPVFSLNGAPVPDFRSDTEKFVLFAGPLFPGQIPPKLDADKYISLGILNVIFVGNPSNEMSVCKDFVEEQGVNWETWIIRDGHIDQIEFAPQAQGMDSGGWEGLSLGGSNPELRAAVREYSACMRSSLFEADALKPGLRGDLESFDASFRKAVANKRLDPSAKHGLLVNANATLSHSASQAFSGNSPILERGTFIYPHTLFGIGVPSLALNRIRLFVSHAFRKVDPLPRFKALRDQEPTPTPLAAISPSDKFWKKDHLFPNGSKTRLPDWLAEEVGKPIVPLLCSFSGRDGFRATQVSMSAPLEVLHACNTAAWTLMTISHEISHTIVEPVLSLLLPNPDLDEELRLAIRRVKSGGNNSLFERLQALICLAFYVLDDSVSARNGKAEIARSAGVPGKRRTSVDDLKRVIRKHWREVNEVLAHCFDFLYFYRKDRAAYVEGIWSSWDVIPNIHDRIPDYLLRTACAVHCSNFDKDNGTALTIKHLTAAFERIDRPMVNKYVEEAQKYLEKNPNRISELLDERELLVRFAVGFLESAYLRRVLSKDLSYFTARREGPYGFRWKVFGRGRIGNPMRFLADFSSGKSPDFVKSTWILYQIAFGDY